MGGVPERNRSGASVKLVRTLSREDFGARACRISGSGTIGSRWHAAGTAMIPGVPGRAS